MEVRGKAGVQCVEGYKGNTLVCCVSGHVLYSQLIHWLVLSLVGVIMLQASLLPPACLLAIYPDTVKW